MERLRKLLSPSALALLATDLSTRRPRLTLVVGLLLTLACGWYARDLRIRTGRLEMAPQDDPELVRFLDFKDRFGSLNQLLLVVSGERAREAADAIARKLVEAGPPIGEAYARIERDAFVRQFLHTLPEDSRKALRQALDDARLDLSALCEEPGLATLLTRWARPGRIRDVPGAERLEALTELVDYLAGRAARLPEAASLLGRGPPTRRVPAWVDEEGWLVGRAGRRHLVIARPADPGDHHSVLLPFAARVMEIASAVASEHGVTLESTGYPALVVAEKRAAEGSVANSALVSIVGVALLFRLAFPSPALPLLGLLLLQAAVVWTCAWARASVGFLTLVSGSFTAIMIGLGIDFAIHLICHFEEAREDGRDDRQALLTAVMRSAPGIITGCMTTTAAFLSMIFTGFPAFQGLGVIAGGGLLLSLVETFTLLPAMILVWNPPRKTGAPPPPGTAVLAHLARTAGRHPQLGLLAACGLGLLALVPAWNLGFDPDLLNMADQRAKPLQLQERMLEEFGFHPSMNALVVDDLETLHRVAARLDELEVVAIADSAARLLPLPGAAASPETSGIASRLRELPAWQSQARPEAGRRATAAARLASRVRDLRILLLARGDARAALAAARLAEALTALAEAEPAGVDAREEVVWGRLRRVLSDLATAAEAPPAGLGDLSDMARRRLVDAGGRFAVLVSPAVDVRRSEEARRFNQELARVAADTGATLTGSVLLTEHMVGLLEQGYRDTCLYTVLAILVLIGLDFRRLDAMAVTLASVVVGVVLTRASMAAAGMAVNPANFVTVPLLLGVGIDNAVHLVHAWLRGAGPEEAVGHAARPLVLNALTSIVGFGGLLVGRHQGLYSLGWAMAVGVFWCAASAFLVVPGLEVTLGRRRQDWDRALESALDHRPR